jgi:hypothetical protein
MTTNYDNLTRRSRLNQSNVMNVVEAGDPTKYTQAPSAAVAGMRANANYGLTAGRSGANLGQWQPHHQALQNERFIIGSATETKRHRHLPEIGHA